VTFHVSLVGRTDLSGEIYRQIRQAILDRRLRPGERLPPTRELATALRVSRSTVTVAYESLLAEGFATSHTGSGTFVSHHLETEGRNYTPAEYSAWLEEAGFRHIETVWFDAPAANGAVIGRKP